MVDRSLLAALRRPAAADRHVLLQPDPHRGVRDRGDQHVPLRARRRRRWPRRWSRRPSAPRRWRPTAADRDRVERVRPRARFSFERWPPGRHRHRPRPRQPRRHRAATDARRRRLAAMTGAGGMAAGRLGEEPPEAGAGDGRSTPRTQLREPEPAARRTRTAARRADREADRKFGKQRRGVWRKAARPGRQSQPRERFVETAYWNPSVVTGKDGKATRHLQGAHGPLRVPVHGAGRDRVRHARRPDRRPRSRSARTSSSTSRSPPSLTQGDKPRFVAQVHHLGVAGTVAPEAGDLRRRPRRRSSPKTLELKGDGVEEVLFEPFEVPDGDIVRLTLTGERRRADGRAGRRGARSAPGACRRSPRPRAPAATTRRSSSACPRAGRTRAPRCSIVVSPTLQRMLVELALGARLLALARRAVSSIVLPPPSNTTADRAADLLAATSALGYLRDSRAPRPRPRPSGSPTRIQGLVAELIAAQNEDGGWPWVDGDRGRGRAEPAGPAAERPRSPRPRSSGPWRRPSALGLLTDPKVARQGGRLARPGSTAGSAPATTRPAPRSCTPSRTRGKAQLRAGQQPEPRSARASPTRRWPTSP